jgi:peptidoglycan/LPS O-acetylase OafA/YrhL
MPMALRLLSLLPTALLAVATHHLVEGPLRKVLLGNGTTGEPWKKSD